MMSKSKLDLQKTIEDTLRSLVEKQWNIDFKIETEEDTVIIEIETVKFFFCESNKDNTNIVVSNGWFDDVIETKNLEPFLHGLAHANCFWANENS